MAELKNWLTHPLQRDLLAGEVRLGHGANRLLRVPNAEVTEAVKLSGRLLREGRLSTVRFFNSRNVPVWAVWQNISTLPSSLPVQAAPAGPKRVDLRVYSAPLFDDRAVLLATSSFVQYGVDITR